MGISSKLKTVFRGDIPLYLLPKEALRRKNAAAKRRAERASLDALNEHPARLLPQFAKLSSAELLAHFRDRNSPSFWPPDLSLSDAQKGELISTADRIADDKSWELMGFGMMKFDGDNVWRRDPVSGHDWGLEYHADLPLARDDGSDVRVLWELNRFGHSITLALAFAATNDERYARTFSSQIEAWHEQNPYARGANWGCAMEVALRAANWLAAFDILRRSRALSEKSLATFLDLIDHHGRYIVDNSEFSYIATSNHYLSDVVGLFWIGTLLPELKEAREWRDAGFKEMLREMDKQVLPDGVDFESSTGYHKLVTEMFDASFALAAQNGIAVPERYLQTLGKMHEYLSAILRPDGGMPLIGDCDGSSFMSVPQAAADDMTSGIGSSAFPNAGTYVLRDKDLYLLFNASNCGLNGRGSHGHNDSLSIEVSALGRPFIVDPGSYAYNLDLDARHEFRSTVYHSTVTIDGVEQNTTDRRLPFILGNEAEPKVLEWSSTDAVDRVTAEHYGYRRLRGPVVHRRSVEFNKDERYWRIVDKLSGSGRHRILVTFHLAPGISADLSHTYIEMSDENGRSLRIEAYGIPIDPHLRDSFYSPNYGKRIATKTLVWEVDVEMPFEASFTITPNDAVGVGRGLGGQ